ncbi:LacI family DNA-binding transcriptional regulator [Natronosporangium hydrolyticum]|uniref:LacI family DNA-binding transcriptional regulator n=1 Tax=Natronosporangium hydrolyticum TaxID=2811111 RepID=A0A895YF32_9ACTN|nr:LacI family DNA-binding transcriptional regulator [Natronosporangium hydrolyticum]QSB16191.1 LacI family DNA-binding transcriptional regulator [Natronosporangium hydrolyticum]
MKVTLQSVADAVGVSRSTVSNAYSRPDQLSPELRERILSTARQLGYAGPHPTARSLRRGRVGAIGVLFTDVLSYAFTDPYAVQFLRGLAETAEQHDTGLLLVPLSLDGGVDSARAVQDAAVDGFCVYCLPDWHPARSALAGRQLPTVTTDLPREVTPQSAFVRVDEAAATRSAGELLTQLGHRRVGIIVDWCRPQALTKPTPLSFTDPAELAAIDEYETRERLRGYYEALNEAGITLPELMIVNATGNSREAGEAAAGQLLDRRDRPTAVVALTDLLALGVLDAMTIRGLWPGRDVSVIGYDDLPEAEVGGVTTIRQDPLVRGRLAGRLLLDPPDDPADRQLTLPTELVVRATTGPALAGDDR